LLASVAPSWRKALRIWRGRNEEAIVLPADDPDRFAILCLQAATARGTTFARLNELFGAGDDRQAGSVEIRGSNTGLTVVIDIDASPLVIQRSGRARLGNRVAFQIRTTRLEGQAARDWAFATFERTCAALAPAWAAAFETEEYSSKVMSEGPRREAIGVDFGRYLPGLFWCNFFGQRYVALIGRHKFNEIKSITSKQVDNGFLLRLYDRPDAWKDLSRRSMTETVLKSLGEEFFFDKHDQSRPFVAPTWEDLHPSEERREGG
jgi:hypothetical protein